MKKVFLAFGTVTLSVAAAFAGRESVRFADPTNIYAEHPVTLACTLLNSGGATAFAPLSTTSSGTQAKITSSATPTPTVYKLYAGINAGACITPVYF